MRRTIATAAMLLAALAPAQAGTAAFARMIDLRGHDVGRARLMTVAHGVLIEIELKGLSPGGHAVALHAQGACDAGKAFASAGPIFSFEPSRPHGYLAKGGPRTGDLPNQFASPDGVLHASVLATAFSLGKGARSIFDSDGAALVVRDRADDYLTQPEGDAGARIACGVIKRTGEPRKAHR